jgi:hypothetical protein
MILSLDWSSVTYCPRVCCTVGFHLRHYWNDSTWHPRLARSHRLWNLGIWANSIELWIPSNTPWLSRVSFWSWSGFVCCVCVDWSRRCGWCRVRVIDWKWSEWGLLWSFAGLQRTWTRPSVSVLFWLPRWCITLLYGACDWLPIGVHEGIHFTREACRGSQ